jgi:quercetin dioxygenase-like cupin family protein
MKTAATVVAILGCGLSLASADPAQKLVVFQAAELKWEPFFPGGPDEAFVVGSKDSKKGPTAFFIKFKGGFDSNWHTHESAYTGIVMSGTIIETSKGQEPVKVTAGSYYLQPTVVHRTQCAAGADCLLYIHEDGKFSFTPTDEAGKPLPPPSAAPKK